MKPKSEPRLPMGVPRARTCVLGGTNLATALTRTEFIKGSFTIETKFGSSPEIHHGESKGEPFFHIPLHGFACLKPELPNAEREALLKIWAALDLIGVEEILGGATAGSINPRYKQGDWVIPDDFVDYNMNRPRSIVHRLRGREAGLVLPRVNPATDPELDQILYESCRKHAPEAGVWKGGVLAQAASGRFESKAEIKVLQMHGCDLSTHVIVTEMVYARQLGINYGCFLGIVNPCEGLGDWNWNTLTDLYPRMHRESIRIYMEAVPRVASLAGKPRVGDNLVVHPELE